MSTPRSTRSIVLREPSIQTSDLKYDAVLEDTLIKPLSPNEVLVKVTAVAFNHRDLWVLKGQYPGIKPGSVLGSDAVGTIIASGRPSDDLISKRVFLVPARGWETDPDAPESHFGILGGGKFPSLGTFSEFIVVERDQVILTPGHLQDVDAAAWPLAGVTAWRATSVNAGVQGGDNVLITGIGGGVALVVMQLCIAKGANVYVTSGSEEKIQKALKLGAKAGVNYKKNEWPSELGNLLKSHHAELSAIIDSGGGDLLGKVGRYLKPGGKLVCYGMTAEPKISFTIREVLKHHGILGSTMGSHKDLIEATEFIEQHGIRPIVSEVIDGFENYKKGFDSMARGAQFGKIVMKIHHADREPKSKL